MPPYIGVIGSRRRWALTVEALVEQGISQADLARVHAPIGLELGAETPKEIAVSIMAEIVMVLRGGTGQSMQWMGRAIKRVGVAKTSAEYRVRGRVHVKILAVSDVDAASDAGPRLSAADVSRCQTAGKLW